VIKGIGIDAVDIERFRTSLARTPSMRDRLFTAEELAYVAPKAEAVVSKDPGVTLQSHKIADGRQVPVLSSTDDVVRTVGRCGAEAVIVAGPVPGGWR